MSFYTYSKLVVAISMIRDCCIRLSFLSMSSHVRKYQCASGSVSPPPSLVCVSYFARTDITFHFASPSTSHQRPLQTPLSTLDRDHTFRTKRTGVFRCLRPLGCCYWLDNLYLHLVPHPPGSYLWLTRAKKSREPSRCRRRSFPAMKLLTLVSLRRRVGGDSLR